MSFLEDIFGLEGKIALVTGGASGIGRMATEALVRAGADVIIASRKLDACQAVADELAPLGKVTALSADLSTPEGAESLAAAVADRTDQLDILMNNSGKTWGAPYGQFPWKAWDSVMSVNVTGLFAVTQALTPLLMKAGAPGAPARVINVGSTVGLRPIGNSAYSYAASKSAVHHLTQILANELAGQNITVNAIAPGPFPSRMMAFVTEDESAAKAMEDSTPLGRLGRPEDIAGTVLMLAGRGGAYITGAILPVDGGTSVQTQNMM